MLTKMCESMGEIVNVHVHGSPMECGAILNACKVLHWPTRGSGIPQGSSGADRLHADQDVQMSRCENSLTSTSTASDGHLSAIKANQCTMIPLRGSGRAHFMFDDDYSICE